jgi:hypothetical protein
MRVPDEIRKSVLFIGIADDPDNPQWRAKGYFLAVPDSIVNVTSELPASRFMVTHHFPFRFLATARHVAEKLEGEEFLLRVNKKGGGVAIIRGHADTKWWYHPTDKNHVDAAITMFAPDLFGEFDIFTVHINIFADDDRIREFNIGPGDEVFMPGLFTKITNTSQNVPIVRLGNLAMMPGERIPFANGMVDAYLVESRSIGGLSGSPVFVRETVQVRGVPPNIAFNTNRHMLPKDLQVVMSGLGRIYFLGSMIGHWEAATGLLVSEREAVNMGISPIVPAQKIKEILTQSGVLEMVKKVTEEIEAKKTDAVLDIADDEPQRNQLTREEFEEALKKVSRKLSDQK